MPQGSVGYAVARIHSRERDGLDAPRIDRLLAASTYEEALRTLSEIGWTGADSGADAEAIAAMHVREACVLVNQVTPSPETTDCFLLRYDGLNLKTLLKARCLGQKPTALSECGTIPVDVLRHAVADHTYKKLPNMLREALDELEKTLAVREDALLIDTTIDKAIFAMIAARAKHIKSKTAKRYFEGRADILNAIMLLRTRRMGRDAQFMRNMLLPGGTIAEKEWARAFDRTEDIPKLLEKYGKTVKNAAALAVQDTARLPGLEKAMDDALLEPFSKQKNESLQIEPVIGHILGAEREAAAVRLILAGKANGFSPDAIRERLRDLYGR